MTEAEWLACQDPTPMLRFLRGIASDRRLRLFACASVRRIWHFLPEQNRNAVEVAEQYADGLADNTALAEAHAALREAINERYAQPAQDNAAMPESLDDRWGAPWCATIAAWWLVTDPGAFDASAAYVQVYNAVCELDDFEVEEIKQRRLLCCIVGDPFRLSPAVEPSWLAWNDGTVPKLAKAIYDARRFADLPILADALEDAGCTDAAILAHCRGPGEPVRGCWVVDLLLGKA